MNELLVIPGLVLKAGINFQSTALWIDVELIGVLPGSLEHLPLVDQNFWKSPVHKCSFIGTVIADVI